MTTHSERGNKSKSAGLENRAREPLQPSRRHPIWLRNQRKLNMALTNAQKQARFRNRNTVVLTAPAAEIAEKLMAMEDQAKLRKIHRGIGKHLEKPKLRNRSKRANALAKIERDYVNAVDAAMRAEGLKS